MKNNKKIWIISAGIAVLCIMGIIIALIIRTSNNDEEKVILLLAKGNNVYLN